MESEVLALLYKHWLSKVFEFNVINKYCQFSISDKFGF